jgi:putative protease
MVELLSPVQDFVSLKAAIDAGADAVYFGLKEFNMRATAKNFKLSELKKVVDLCHKNKIKAYLTLNTVVYENELSRIKQILKKVKEAEIDAIHAWDMSVINEAKKLKIPIHLSTQASVSNSEAVKFYKKLGIKRIILARECSLEQIKKIKKEVKGLELEVFIHGAMCVSISGRCFISQFEFKKSANRGECLQPCRRDYIIEDEEGNKLRLGKNYVLSPKDLCTLPIIDKLIKAKIDAFKIEGRNRSPEYVKIVTEVYREAIDKGYKPSLLKKVKSVYNRGFSTGFFLGTPTKDDWTNIYGSKATTRKVYIGKIIHFYSKIKVAEIKIETGKLKTGDKIMIQGNKTGVIEDKITSIEISHKNIKEIKKGQKAGIKLKNKARSNDRVYLIIKKKSNFSTKK